MIYLDNNATTFLDPRVLECIYSTLNQPLGNPSSVHQLGQKAKGCLTLAQREIANFFQINPYEVILTSGATEGLNAIIQSFSTGHVITSNLEHPAVLSPLQKMEKKGLKVSYLSVHPEKGALDPEQIEKAILPDTKLIILMAANNETGIKTDSASIAEIAVKYGIPFVVDGVSILGKEPFFLYPGISAVCFSGHKIHGPQGSGLTILTKNFKIDPLIVGGMQQQARRGGTENLPAILGLAKALSLLKEEQQESIEHMLTLRNSFEEEIKTRFPRAVIHGEKESRLCNTSNIAFPGIDGETLMIYLDQAGIAASLGSACSSGGLEPSRVLLNMGISPSVARSSVRFSSCKFNTLQEIELTIESLHRIIKFLSPG
jgi:cysteine desulfurase